MIRMDQGEFVSHAEQCVRSCVEEGKLICVQTEAGECVMMDGNTWKNLDRLLHLLLNSMGTKEG